MRQLREGELHLLKDMKKANGGKKLRTAIYARKSTEDKTDTSLATQLKQCREFIRKYGSLLNLGKNLVFEEDEVSGYNKDRRSEFNRLNNELEEGNIDVIVTYKIDRISRNLSHREPILTKISESGAYIIAGDDLGDDSATGVLLSQLQWALNEFHIRNIAENVMNVHTKLVLDDKTVGGPGNYGYVIKNRNYVREPIEALAVELVFDLFLQGHSYSQISDILREKGYKPRKSNIFTNSSIHDILRNRRNCGESIWNAESKRKNRDRVLKREYPEVMSKDVVLEPIIDKDDFERVQLILDTRNGGVLNKEGKIYMLTGLIKCSCGSSMSGTSTKKKGRTNPHYTYQCRMHSKRYGNVCPTKNINALFLEKYIKKSLTSIINNQIKQNGLDSDIVSMFFEEEKARIRRLKRKVAKNNNDLTDMIKGYHSEQDEEIKLLTGDKIKDIQHENILSKARIKEISKLVKATTDKVEFLKQGNLQVKDIFVSDIISRRIAALFIDEIIVSNDSVEINLKEGVEI